ncbi:ABC transporter ATP-binding protein [Endozoicomonas sp. OPT23]|uniref:ATP-binding cassette domain-containing protein n=1 Tax=Endozoicomonas sp. OPT23 TaxID=2072845 RepID=UPI00129B930E|nr:ATP-binding cassette domain-containing protein [Endozoicomonas sp. OPT23]MRI35445.1 ABC transporter ATP-binding protein [Endozoicomonas sp. OPT23]
MTLEVSELCLSLAGKPLVQKLSFVAKPGQVLGIMGPSGCGKSSILDFLCGTLSSSFSSSGQILLDGKDISSLQAYQRRVGLQLQDHLLFPHLTVTENLKFGLPVSYKGKSREEKVQKALLDCQLPDIGHKNPATLSGGQRARISLMRTLLSEPRALLLDEPFSKLDPELRGQFRRFVFEQVKGLDIPVVMVTHDQGDLPDNVQMVVL